jgi:hypothetical protein
VHSLILAWGAGCGSVGVCNGAGTLGALHCIALQYIALHGEALGGISIEHLTVFPCGTVAYIRWINAMQTHHTMT